MGKAADALIKSIFWSNLYLHMPTNMSFQLHRVLKGEWKDQDGTHHLWAGVELGWLKIRPGALLTQVQLPAVARDFS